MNRRLHGMQVHCVCICTYTYMHTCIYIYVVHKWSIIHFYTFHLVHLNAHKIIHAELHQHVGTVQKNWCWLHILQSIFVSQKHRLIGSKT